MKLRKRMLKRMFHPMTSHDGCPKNQTMPVTFINRVATERMGEMVLGVKNDQDSIN